MDRWAEKIAVVTGASGGIGSAIVTGLLKYKITVVGLGRNEAKMTKLAENISGTLPNAKFYPLQCDVSDEDSIVQCFEKIEKKIGPVSILINNAGVGTRKPLLESSSEDINKILRTNVTSIIICSREAINMMTKNKIYDGHIINISSIADSIPTNPPIPSVIYTVSKHGVRLISEGIRQELLKKYPDIKVTNLSPAAVDTNIIADVEWEHKLKPEIISDACISVLQTPPGVLIRQLTISSVREPLL